MAFCTGSVVVPLTSETMARFWPVSALTRLDLPALRRPNSPMWVRTPEGAEFMLMVLFPLSFIISAVDHNFIACRRQVFPQGAQALRRFVPAGRFVIIQ